MSGLVDIHCHILPGIDDGPSNMPASLDMARAAIQSGIVTVAATPHLRSDFPDVHVDELSGRCSQLRDAIADDGIGLEIVSGAEVSLPWALDASDEELRLASYAQRGDTILIEAPMTPTTGLPRLVYEIRMRGYKVVLAHVERVVDAQRDSSIISDLFVQGVVLQVNAESLLSNSRRSAYGKLARSVCSDGRAGVLASDGHRGPGKRPISALRDAEEALGRLVGDARATWMMSEHPRSLLEGGEIVPPPTAEKHPRSRLFGRR